MAWTNMGTKANGVVIDQGDWNQMVNNFAYLGGTTGDTKTGPLNLAVTSASQGLQVSRAGRNFYFELDGAPNAQIRTDGTIIVFSGPANLLPASDNAMALGGPSNRFSVVYAGTGTINTSRREYKEAFVPVDPAHALDVVRRTPILSYNYTFLPDRRFTGFIADDADVLLSPDHDSVDAGTTAAIALAAVQALALKVDALEAAR